MKRILVVDDDKDITSLLTLQLTNEKYEVDVAVDAKEAIQHMRKKKPDLLILDISLPLGSAFTIIESMRATPGLGLIGIPFIFLTKKDDPKLKEQALQLGAKEYVIKPYEWQSLLKIIRSILFLKIDTNDL